LANWGTWSNIFISVKDIIPVTGGVATQAQKREPTCRKLTAFQGILNGFHVMLLTSPTPTVAPVAHIELETGREYQLKIKTVMNVAICIETPLTGDGAVILLPITLFCIVSLMFLS
jgi:hypothetical protein